MSGMLQSDNLNVITDKRNHEYKSYLAVQLNVTSTNTPAGKTPNKMLNSEKNSYITFL